MCAPSAPQICSLLSCLGLSEAEKDGSGEPSHYWSRDVGRLSRADYPGSGDACNWLYPVVNRYPTRGTVSI